MAFTYFFRDLQTLDLITKHVIPLTTGRSRIRIWDAGCANGPEPYSLAIMFAENMGRFSFKNLQILASDIDESNLFGKIIGDGIFSREETQRIPKDIFDKYFSSVNGNGNYKIDHAIMSRVTYKKHDLLSLKPLGDNFSLILCKNVLLHISYENRIKVIEMFHESLMQGGFFAMEQTQDIPGEVSGLFEKVVSHGKLYRKV